MHGREAVRAVVVLAVMLTGCAGRNIGRESAGTSGQGVILPAGVVELERAHGAGAWRRHQAVQTEIIVEFDKSDDDDSGDDDTSSDDGRRGTAGGFAETGGGENTRGGSRTIDGVLTFTTDGTKSRLDLRSGVTLVFDGAHAWVTPPNRKFPDARFHLRIWPYFIAVPFKLRDGGVKVASLGEQPLAARMYPSLRLTFEPGTGDSPRDWYLLYRDPETNRLKAMAYTTNYGLPPGEKPDDPRAVVYDDFRDVQGATLATHWTFYRWVAGAGISGDPIGRATLRNLHFTTAPEGFFEKPEGAREDRVPGTFSTPPATRPLVPSPGDPGEG
jgi:hypothetical protein